MLLDWYRRAHESTADAYIKDNWREMDKNDLINKYLEVEEDPQLADAYMSAIICRYWWKIYSYSRSSVGFLKSGNVEPETYYDWLVEAIQNALRNRVWKNPNNVLYNDPNGPDKAVTICATAERKRWFQAANQSNRKAVFGKVSLDVLSDMEASWEPSYRFDENSNSDIDFVDAVRNAFDRGDYFMAFLIDTLVRYDTEKGHKDTPTLSRRKVIKHIKYPETGYDEKFASAFGIPVDDVRDAMKVCREYSKETVLKTLDEDINILKRSCREHQIDEEAEIG